MQRAALQLVSGTQQMTDYIYITVSWNFDRPAKIVKWKIGRIFFTQDKNSNKNSKQHERSCGISIRRFS